MSSLKETLLKKIEEHRPRTTRLLKEHGDTKVMDIKISQVIGGARGIRCLVTDISYLDPLEGIRFRGRRSRRRRSRPTHLSLLQCRERHRDARRVHPARAGEPFSAHEA